MCALSDKTGIPQHRIADIVGDGIGIFYGENMEDRGRGTYSHRDDYYVFCAAYGGDIRGRVDFRDVVCHAHDCLVVSPGQVHRFVSADVQSVVAIVIDPCHVDARYADALARFTLRGNVIALAEEVAAGLKGVAAVVASGRWSDAGFTLRRDAANLMIGMLVSQIPPAGDDGGAAGRYSAVAVRLRELLRTETDFSHPASHYAAALNISTSYLNEAVRAVTGQSTTAYVREQMAVRAKRLLAYSDSRVADIGMSLGFADNAYFSRIFSRSAGMSPSEFRTKNRESSNRYL